MWRRWRSRGRYVGGGGGSEGGQVEELLLSVSACSLRIPVQPQAQRETHVQYNTVNTHIMFGFSRYFRVTVL